jgi:serine/threonine protein kinase
MLWRPGLHDRFSLQARMYSIKFPPGHSLNAHFVQVYQLGAELGSGGYGFVMTAHHRIEGHEVAVKFIIKAKVPENAWMEDEELGILPSEIMLLSFLNHPNIVKCLDVFEDNLYFYLVYILLSPLLRANVDGLAGTGAARNAVAQGRQKCRRAK